MKQIDKYVNSIYRNVSGDPLEIEELRHEMRSHLIETVQELKAEGLTEKEAIRIAIENFGGKGHLEEELSEFFTVQKRFSNYVLLFALVFLSMSIIFLISSIKDVKEFNQEVSDIQIVVEERKSIMDDAFDILDSSGEVTEREKEQLLGVFDKYQDQLNFLAVFPAADFTGLLEENTNLLHQPTTHFPIDYDKAAIAIGDNGILENKENIVASDYDRGTVIMANKQWIIQYEYNRSYEHIVEKQLQLEYYGPSMWSFFQLPILFFVLFIVLGVVWLFMNRQNKQLKNVMN